MLDFGPLEEEDQPKQHKSKLKKKRITIILAFIIIGALAAAGILFSQSGSPGKLPDNIVNSLTFPVYYPSNKPSGFRYKQSSAKITTGFLYYKFYNGSKVISVTEEAVPSGVNLHALPNHSDIQVSIGKAVAGTSLGNPSAVILTSTTLVNITSTKAVSKDEVSKFAQSLSLVKNQNTY